MNKLLIGQIMCGIGIGIVFSAVFTRVLNSSLGVLVGMGLGVLFALGAGAVLNRRK